MKFVELCLANMDWQKDSEITILRNENVERIKLSQAKLLYGDRHVICFGGRMVKLEEKD